MRFPLGLRAALLNSRISGILGGASTRQPISVFSACATHPSPRLNFDEPSTELEWHSAEVCIARANGSKAPVVWLSGTDPLFHPEIASLADGIVRSDRHVFLHTNGYSLRQRIHEFRPDSRLFLTLDFAGREEIHNRTTGRADAFQRSLEAIRAAKLSGFLVAAHFAVTDETNSCDVGELIEFLDEKDVDGFIVSGGGHAAGLGAEALH